MNNEIIYIPWLICTMYVAGSDGAEEAISQQRIEIEKDGQKKALNHQRFRLLSKYWCGG